MVAKLSTIGTFVVRESRAYQDTVHTELHLGLEQDILDVLEFIAYNVSPSRQAEVARSVGALGPLVFGTPALHGQPAQARVFDLAFARPDPQEAQQIHQAHLAAHQYQGSPNQEIIPTETSGPRGNYEAAKTQASRLSTPQQRAAALAQADQAAHSPTTPYNKGGTHSQQI